jgi:rhamnogalacturonan hydrolase
MQLQCHPLLLSLLSLTTLASGQLTGKVGPITSHATKSAKRTCNITSHGAKPGKAGDIGPALKAAFLECRNGGTILIPPGDWGLGTWVEMSGGEHFAIQWDGIIHRTGTSGNNMIVIRRSKDVEIFSSTGKGAFQGNGYRFPPRESQREKPPRILRLEQLSDFSVHDIMLIDSPFYHLNIMAGCRNGEIYNIIIRGAYHGETDGISIIGNNIWVHDVRSLAWLQYANAYGYRSRSPTEMNA